MKKCQMCNEEKIDNQFDICGRCSEFLKTNVGLLCQFCGAIGFVARTPENFKFLQHMHPSLDIAALVKTNLPIIIRSKSCPDCNQVQQPVPENLIN